MILPERCRMCENRLIAQGERSIVRIVRFGHCIRRGSGSVRCGRLARWLGWRSARCRRLLRRFCLCGNWFERRAHWFGQHIARCRRLIHWFGQRIARCRRLACWLRRSRLLHRFGCSRLLHRFGRSRARLRPFLPWLGRRGSRTLFKVNLSQFHFSRCFVSHQDTSPLSSS